MVKPIYLRNSKIHETFAEVPIFPDDGASQKGSSRWARWAPRHTWARLACGPRRAMAWPTGSTPQVAPSRISSSGKTKLGGIVHEIFRRLHGTKTTEREKLSGREKSVEEIPSQRGEIIAIVIVITLDFIGIIIIHRAITIISAAPLRSAVTSRVVPCLVHWGDSLGVNYYMLLMLLSLFGGLRFMSRLLFITISSLIMIHIMSCE